jgi:predicted Zn-dependent protease
MVARVATVLVAVVVLAWLGVMERDRRLQARGVALAGNLRTAADVTHAESDLRAARLLNPDTMPDINRALVYRFDERFDDAISLVQDVLRREPENRAAWGGLYALSRNRDPATADRARAALTRLDPVNAPR